MGQPPAQTPCIFVEGGGTEFFDEACLKALAECGYSPEMFGTYKSVDSQIKAAKAGKLSPPMTPEAQAFLAGSQSGHISQNALFQGQGGRENSCKNHLMGAAGYSTGGAPCMPHHGGSTDPGTTHQVITVNEGPNARAAAGGGPGTPMNQTQIATATQQTVTTAVSGPSIDPSNRGRTPAELDARAAAAGGGEAGRREANLASSEAAQQRSAASMAGAGGTGAAAGAKPKGRQTDAATEQKAIDCIMAFWRAGMDEMRRSCAENQNSAAALAAQNGGKAPTPAQVAKRRADKAAEAAKCGAKKGRASAACNAACLEDQANRLQDHMAPPPQGSGGVLPPLAGEVGGARPTGTSAGGTGSTGTSV